MKLTLLNKNKFLARVLVSTYPKNTDVAYSVKDYSPLSMDRDLF